MYKDILETAAQNTGIEEGWDIFMFCDKEKSISNMIEELDFNYINFHIKYGIKHREKHMKALDAYKELKVAVFSFSLVMGTWVLKLGHCTVSLPLFCSYAIPYQA